METAADSRLPPCCILWRRWGKRMTFPNPYTSYCHDTSFYKELNLKRDDPHLVRLRQVIDFLSSTDHWFVILYRHEPRVWTLFYGKAFKLVNFPFEIPLEWLDRAFFNGCCDKFGEQCHFFDLEGGCAVFDPVAKARGIA